VKGGRGRTEGWRKTHGQKQTHTYPLQFFIHNTAAWREMRERERSRERKREKKAKKGITGLPALIMALPLAGPGRVNFHEIYFFLFLVYSLDKIMYIEAY
jgi:hypothetical protein